MKQLQFVPPPVAANAEKLKRREELLKELGEIEESLKPTAGQLCERFCMSDDEMQMDWAEYAQKKGFPVYVNKYGVIDTEKTPSEYQSDGIFRCFYVEGRSHYHTMKKFVKLWQALEKIKRAGFDPKLTDPFTCCVQAKSKSGQTITYYANTEKIAGHSEGIDEYIRLLEET